MDRSNFDILPKGKPMTKETLNLLLRNAKKFKSSLSWEELNGWNELSLHDKVELLKDLIKDKL
jgi:hypothetical protein